MSEKPGAPQAPGHPCASLAILGSRYCLRHDPEALEAFRKWLKVLIPFGLLLVSLKLFIPQDPTHPIARWLAQTGPWMTLIVTIAAPCILLHVILRETAFGAKYRFIIAFFCWLVPPTFMYVARYQNTGVRKDFEYAPIFTSLWFLTAIAGAVVLGYAAVSGKPSPEAVAPPDDADRGRSAIASSATASSRFKEALGTVAAIATILGLLWTILRDLAR